MSSNLIYTVPSKDNSFCCELKFILRRVYKSDPINEVLTDQDIGILRGISGATEHKEVQKDIKKLINLIHRYTEVTLSEDFG